MTNHKSEDYKNRDVKYTSCNKTRKRKPKEYL